jgi:hypothetical protein
MKSVLEAALSPDPHRREPVPQEQVELWRRLLRSDRRGMAQPEIPVEALYDEITGLPK